MGIAQEPIALQNEIVRHNTTSHLVWRRCRGQFRNISLFQGYVTFVQVTKLKMKIISY